VPIAPWKPAAHRPSSADWPWAGAVDLVGQQQVGEDRTRLEAELALAVLLDQDVGADDVGRHQVGRELDAVEGAVDDVGDGAHQHRLAQARHSLEKGVAVGDEADQRLADEIVLAHDDRLDLGLDGPRAVGELLNGQLGRLGLERGRHVGLLLG
jgi:hypothetical protein